MRVLWRFRRQSSPSTPNNSRRLFAGKSWVSTLTSALSKHFKRSKANPSRSSFPKPTSVPPDNLNLVSGLLSFVPILSPSSSAALLPPTSSSDQLESIPFPFDVAGTTWSSSLSLRDSWPLDAPLDESEMGVSSEEDSREERGRRPGPISKLPDHVLLDIFDLYRVLSESPVDQMTHTWPWKTLVHVCQTWRYLVFASPHRLDLRLVCDFRTPVRKTLGMWPVLPIIIRSNFKLPDSVYRENVVAALEHRDRIREIELKNLTSSSLSGFTALMQEPFPTLTGLCLSSDDGVASGLPDDFSGGSGPSLQYFELDGISFPAVPKFLLSTTHLVSLGLRRIPYTGYISPKAMATCLAALPNLESLILEFQSPRSHSSRENRHPTPLTRTILPALTTFDFQGVSEYLDDLVAQINAPLLDRARFRFFNQLTFNTPQLPQFINRTEKLKSLGRADLELLSEVVKITLSSTVGRVKLELGISCNKPDWQVSSIAQLCGQLSALISRVEELDVRKSCILRSEWPEDMECTQWLELFDPFVAVETLGIPQLVVPALLELTGEGTTDVLPMMRSLSLRGLKANTPIKDDLEPFVSARQSSNHPVSVLWGA